MGQSASEVAKGWSIFQVKMSANNIIIIIIFLMQCLKYVLLGRGSERFRNFRGKYDKCRQIGME